MEIKEKKKTTISIMIAETLKQEINYGKIRAGEEILEKGIANRFHASNIPVREALRLLKEKVLSFTVNFQVIVFGRSIRTRW